MEEISSLVSSGKCQTVVVVGHTVEIEVYRLESSSYWTLEVVDEEGAAGFLYGGENVVPFQRD